MFRQETFGEFTACDFCLVVCTTPTVRRRFRVHGWLEARPTKDLFDWGSSAEPLYPGGGQDEA